MAFLNYGIIVNDIIVISEKYNLRKFEKKVKRYDDPFKQAKPFNKGYFISQTEEIPL